MNIEQSDLKNHNLTLLWMSENFEVKGVTQERLSEEYDKTYKAFEGIEASVNPHQSGTYKVLDRKALRL